MIFFDGQLKIKKLNVYKTLGDLSELKNKYQLESIGATSVMPTVERPVREKVRGIILFLHQKKAWSLILRIWRVVDSLSERCRGTDFTSCVQCGVGV